MSDLSTKGFDKAVSNYEKTTLDMSLSSVEFNKKNTFLNIVKSMNYANPNLFKSDLLDSSINRVGCGWCKCAAATVALVVATAGLASCLTVVACGLSIVLVYAASNGVAAACAKE